MPLYIAQSGDLEGCHACLTDRLTTLKDRATQLLIKFKTGALVTQFTNLTSLGQSTIYIGCKTLAKEHLNICLRQNALSNNYSSHTSFCIC